MKSTRLKYAALSFLMVSTVLALIPLLYYFQLRLIRYFPTDLETSLQISLGDSLTMASVIGAAGAFILERYWTAARNERDRLSSAALRLMLKQVREQSEPRTIEEHWQIFKNDLEGRKVYCKGRFGEVSLDDFTAEIYTLRLEGQVDITAGDQIVYRTPFHMKVKKLSNAEKTEVIEILTALAQEGETVYIRERAIDALSDIHDSSIVDTIKGYLGDHDQKVQLEAARAMIKLASFPEN